MVVKLSITITVCSTTPLTAQTNAKPETVEDLAGNNPAWKCIGPDVWADYFYSPLMESKDKDIILCIADR